MFLVFSVLLGSNYWFVSRNLFGADRDILGGPATVTSSQFTYEHKDVLLAAGAPAVLATPEMETSGGYANFLSTSKDVALSNSGSLLGGILSKRDGVFVYKAQKGDTLNSLADSFGVSTETIIWANASISKKNKSFAANQELIILPISGVLHQVAMSDTINSIAENYGVLPQQIAKTNNLPGDDDKLIPGQKLIIPEGKPKKDLALLVKANETSLPSYVGYYKLPVPQNSRNLGKLHTHNAVDISNVCGTDIYAAADGYVSKIGWPSGWNSGYGGFLELKHINDTKTLYAHTEENMVSLGDVIKQGDLIAKIGRTGNVTGQTGCHLHFEVHGARNPFQM